MIPLGYHERFTHQYVIVNDYFFKFPAHNIFDFHRSEPYECIKKVTSMNYC